MTWDSNWEMLTTQCTKDFVVSAQAGSTVQNFTLWSNGTGSSKEFLMKFQADSGLTLISFQGYTTCQTKEGMFCGPVIDDVVLQDSHGVNLKIQWQFLISVYLLAILCFHYSC